MQTHANGLIYSKIRFLNDISKTSINKQAIKSPSKTCNVKHRSSPVINEIHSPEFWTEYFKLTIVSSIANAKRGIPKIESPIKTKNIVFLNLFIQNPYTKDTSSGWL